MLLSTFITVALIQATTSLGLKIPNVHRQENSTSTTTASPVAPTEVIQTPTPHGAGMTENCNKFHRIAPGDICERIAEKYPGVSLEQLYAWNLDIHNPYCDNLYPNIYLCVGVVGSTPSPTSTPIDGPTPSPKPSPLQPGTVDYCQKYYKVIENDNCLGVAFQANITTTDFYEWNPTVGGPGCQHLREGYYVCIGI